MTIAQHSSETAEHGTPADIIEASRVVLGGIDLDPASNAAFNRVVKAKRYFNERRNGYNRDWHGHIFLNPPGGLCDYSGRRVIRKKDHGFIYPNGMPALQWQSAMAAWWFRLAEEYVIGNTRTAIFIGFSLELLQRTQSFRGRGDHPIPIDFPFCVPERRLKFMKQKDKKLVEGAAPTHANVIVLLPRCLPDYTINWEAKQVDTFKHEFSKFGRVVVPNV